MCACVRVRVLYGESEADTHTGRERERESNKKKGKVTLPPPHPQPPPLLPSVTPFADRRPGQIRGGRAPGAALLLAAGAEGKLRGESFHAYNCCVPNAFVCFFSLFAERRVPAAPAQTSFTCAVWSTCDSPSWTSW